MADAFIYAGLVVVTTVYAIALDRLQSRQGPNWTWVEVVFGTALCLAAAALRARFNPAMSWDEYERGVWLSFLFGSAPIIIWQMTQMYRRLLSALAYARERNEQSEETGEEMAEDAGGSTGTDAGGGRGHSSTGAASTDGNHE